LAMTTIDAAEAFGIDDEVGSLESDSKLFERF